MPRHPRARFITIYGRRPVLEVLHDPSVSCASLRIARRAHGPTLDAIERAAARRGLPVQRVPASEVSRISRRPHQDQGVVLDAEAPHMDDLTAVLARGEVPRLSLLLDGVTTPANVGMLIRTCVAADAAVILPRQGVPEVGPRVVKASAGTAFSARILRAGSPQDAAAALAAHGACVVGLDPDAALPLDAPGISPPVVFVAGGETHGISPEVRACLDERRAIPMARPVGSLNVAVAGSFAVLSACRRWPHGGP